MQISTLRPGLLVSLSTRVTGNVTYATKELEAEHTEEDGALVRLWETERTVQKPDEHEAAIKIKSKARAMVTGICSLSSFGLLCPESKSVELRERIQQAQDLADAFNREAAITRVAIFAIVGRVAQDDVQAIRAINSEVRELMDAMESGLQRLDVEAIRSAANRARNLGSMLSPDAANRVKEAVETARTAARKIVKAAETGTAAVDEAVLTKLRQSRTAFLDIEGEDIVAAPTATSRAIDLEEGGVEMAPTAPAVKPYAMDLEDIINQDEPAKIQRRAATPAIELPETMSPV